MNQETKKNTNLTKKTTFEGVQVKVKTVLISELKLDENNARDHNEENIDMIAKSLSDVGQHKPLIVDKRTNVVLAGNGRLMAMRKLGWTECRCVYKDAVENVGLEIVDNRSNEFGEWEKDDIFELIKEKGSEWWGFDDKIKNDYERKEKRTKNSTQQNKTEIKARLCPCCGEKVKKKIL